MILEREGYAVNVCRSVAEFRRHPDAQRADAYLLDMKLPDGSGIDLLKVVKQNGAPSPAIMISGHGTIADAVEATRAGAFDFLEKPLSRDRVLLAVKNAHGATRRSSRRTSGCANWWAARREMIGSSPAWVRAVEQASMAARSDARVLLIGESGTGKELLAAHIHNSSPFCVGSVREGELRGDSDGTDRDRAVRARKGLVHRRDGVAPRQVRAGGRRDDFSGRGGRSARRVAGQTAAGAAGGRVPPRRRRGDHPGERAGDLGDQSRSERRWWRRRNFARTCTTA